MFSIVSNEDAGGDTVHKEVGTEAIMPYLLQAIVF